MNDVYIRWLAITTAAEALDYKPMIKAPALAAYEQARKSCGVLVIEGRLSHEHLDTFQEVAQELVREMQAKDAERQQRQTGTGVSMKGWYEHPARR